MGKADAGDDAQQDGDGATPPRVLAEERDAMAVESGGGLNRLPVVGAKGQTGDGTHIVCLSRRFSLLT